MMAQHAQHAQPGKDAEPVPSRHERRATADSIETCQTHYSITDCDTCIPATVAAAELPGPVADHNEREAPSADSLSPRSSQTMDHAADHPSIDRHQATEPSAAHMQAGAGGSLLPSAASAPHPPQQPSGASDPTECTSALGGPGLQPTHDHPSAAGPCPTPQPVTRCSDRGSPRAGPSSSSGTPTAAAHPPAHAAPRTTTPAPAPTTRPDSPDAPPAKRACLAAPAATYCTSIIVPRLPCVPICHPSRVDLPASPTHPHPAPASAPTAASPPPPATGAAGGSPTLPALVSTAAASYPAPSHPMVPAASLPTAAATATPGAASAPPHTTTLLVVLPPATTAPSPSTALSLFGSQVYPPIAPAGQALLTGTGGLPPLQLTPSFHLPGTAPLHQATSGTFLLAPQAAGRDPQPATPYVLATAPGAFPQLAPSTTFMAGALAADPYSNGPQAPFNKLPAPLAPAASTTVVIQHIHITYSTAASRPAYPSFTPAAPTPSSWPSSLLLPHSNAAASAPPPLPTTTCVAAPSSVLRYVPQPAATPHTIYIPATAPLHHPPSPDPRHAPPAALAPTPVTYITTTASPSTFPFGHPTQLLPQPGLTQPRSLYIAHTLASTAPPATLLNPASTPPTCPATAVLPPATHFTLGSTTLPHLTPTTPFMLHPVNPLPQ